MTDKITVTLNPGTHYSAVRFDAKTTLRHGETIELTPAKFDKHQRVLPNGENLLLPIEPDNE